MHVVPWKYADMLLRLQTTALRDSILFLILLLKGKGLVGMADVEAAIQEMFQAPHIQVIKSYSKLSKIFLTALVHELYKTGMSETNFEKISGVEVMRWKDRSIWSRLATTVSCLCASNGVKFPGWDSKWNFVDSLISSVCCIKLWTLLLLQFQQSRITILKI